MTILKLGIFRANHPHTKTIPPTDPTVSRSIVSPYSTNGASAKLHEAPPIYRCGDLHWHFMPHKQDYDPETEPWWRRRESPEKYKFPSGSVIYVQGRGDVPFTLRTQYESGFCTLRSGTKAIWCGERYCGGRDEQFDEALWRVEELSLIPWVPRKEEMPPPYESSSSSSSSSSLSLPEYTLTDSNLSTDQGYYEDDEGAQEQ